MKRFVFRLQTVLDHRRSIEQALLGELAHVQYEEKLEKARLTALESAKRTSWETLAALATNGAAPRDLENASEHCRALGDDVKLQELTLSAAHRKVEEKLAEVMEAAKKRKVLEKLSDRQRREHELAAAKLEQNELDEMASVRYARQAA